MKRLMSMACLCSIVLVLGCGGDGGGPSDTASSLTAAGWTLFDKGEYNLAIDKFERALGLDADYADAYNGLGWTHAKLDSLAYSLGNFGMCVTKDPELTEGYAGCVPVYRDHKVGPTETAHYDSAVAFALTALTQESDFEFSHGTSFNWRDLRLIMAQSHYGLGEFLLAKAQVDILNPDNELDPDGDFNVFVTELAAEIERLEGEGG